MVTELWVLFFIMYIGIAWITILHRLKQIEKSLNEHKSDGEDSTPSKAG